MSRENSESLYERLLSYSRTDTLPMHMPGHKRNGRQNGMENPYLWDITEIDGFDDLHEPEGILQEGMELAAELYGSDHCWYLVNGSTGGILAGISACARRGKRILMARNCHKSVYNAVEINRMEPVYLHPGTDPVTGILTGVEPAEVAAKLETVDEIALVVITSPTYEGILSDVQMIAGICHRKGIPLLVDEAHGAHLSSGRLYGSCFPEGAVACGADLVIQSLHKTLPSFTQTGLIHLQGELVRPEEVKHFLDIVQTSSPSYILMAGIDRCVRMMRESGREIMGEWAEGLNLYYRMTENLKVLKPVTLDTCERFFAWDPSKLVLSTRGSGHTGRDLTELLRSEYRIETEMTSRDYVIAMTGAGDTVDTIRRFAEAVKDIDCRWLEERQNGEKRQTAAVQQIRENRQKAAERQREAEQEQNSAVPSNRETPDFGSLREEIVLPPWEAAGREGTEVPLASGAAGHISLEFVYAYPPGIPVLVPGERITEPVLQLIGSFEAAGISLRGYIDRKEHKIRVLD